MSRNQFMRWEKLRQKGMKYFLARSAVISGLFFFLFLNIASWFWSGRSLPVAFLIFYPAAGSVVGFVLWWINEERYHHFLSEKKIGAGLRR